MADMEAAVTHCTEGIGIWQWASNDQDARRSRMSSWRCCGDTPTLEILAAVFYPSPAPARSEKSEWSMSWI